jgi:hypothetical protein
MLTCQVRPHSFKVLPHYGSHPNSTSTTAACIDWVPLPVSHSPLPLFIESRNVSWRSLTNCPSIRYILWLWLSPQFVQLSSSSYTRTNFSELTFCYWLSTQWNRPFDSTSQQECRRTNPRKTWQTPVSSQQFNLPNSQQSFGLSTPPHSQSCAASDKL